jgi:hypothetical protein
MTPDNKGIIALNKRVYNPVIIDSQSNANYMMQNANYTLTGTEKYVNSGWLLPRTGTNISWLWKYIYSYI